MSENPTLLIVDDDADNLDSYALGFARQPYRLLRAQGGAQALEALRAESVDIVLTDLKMPDVDGLEVTRAAAALPVPPAVIVITAFGTIETAVEAMRLGALDYLTKPVNLMELRAKVEKAAEMRGLRVENASLQGLLNARFRFEGVIGVSKEMQRVIDQARMAARSRASVLVEGESGTGKELIARAIHFNSPRAAGPFVPIHCAALSESLLESELFGHEKGAFTGAISRRIGQFESADGGTVFLDELSEIPPSTQVKLLRVLEQREIMRVGGNRPISLDMRLVGATNKDLAEEVREGRFREDLFYRLHVVAIRIPPLRERVVDIPPLVRHFLETLAKENNRAPLEITAEALDVLTKNPWPGNIRELRNALEQTIVFLRSDRIDVEDLPGAVRPSAAELGNLVLREDMTLDEIERACIQQTLAKVGNNRTRAAEKLGISRRTLQRKLKTLGSKWRAPK